MIRRLLHYSVLLIRTLFLAHAIRRGDDKATMYWTRVINQDMDD